VLFLDVTSSERSGQELNLVVQNVLCTQHTDRNAADIDNRRSAQRSLCVGKEVQSQPGRRVDQLDEEFRIARVRQVVMRHEKIARNRWMDRVDASGHEINIFGSEGWYTIAAHLIDVEADGHASGQGDLHVIQVRQEPTQALVQ